MKTPLEDSVSTDVVRMCIVDFADEWPSLVILISELCNEVDQLRSAHAAQPGAPREDGSWIIRTEGGQEHIAYKRVEIRWNWYWECSNGIYIPEESIVAHRKHTPLEVPK